MTLDTLSRPVRCPHCKEQVELVSATHNRYQLLDIGVRELSPSQRQLAGHHACTSRAVRGLPRVAKWGERKAVDAGRVLRERAAVAG